MTRFGRCCICTTPFFLSDVTSLRCGHTFHAECIHHWLQNSKTCPHCRKKTLVRDAVKLFFDEADASFTQPAESQNSEKAIEDLTVELTKVRADNQKLLTTFEEFQTEMTSLKSQLKQEKKKTKTLVAKDERISSLEQMLRDQSEMADSLKTWKARVNASEFFAYLMRKGDQNEQNPIDSYLKGSGEIESKKFIELLRGQRHKLSQQVKELEIEKSAMKRKLIDYGTKIRKYKQLMLDFKHEADHLKGKIAVMEHEQSDQRLSDIVNHNTDSIVRPTRPRKSFGFSFAEDSLDRSELLRSARRSVEAPSSRQQQPTCSKTLIEVVEAEKENAFDNEIYSTEDNVVSVEEIDVPVANSMTYASKSSTKDSLLGNKILIPKRKLSSHTSNFNKSIAILDELEFKSKTSTAVNNSKKLKLSKSGGKGSQNSKSSSSSAQGGIKRYLSDPKLDNVTISTKTAEKFDKSSDSSDASLLYVTRKGRRRASSGGNGGVEIIDLE